MLSPPYQFACTESDDRVRLDALLFSHLGGVSRIRISRLISEGLCRVNGQPRDAGHKMSPGDIVLVGSFEITPTAMTPERFPLEIAFEDDEIAVVVKPAGMLVHPTIGVKRGTLVSGLVYHFNKDVFDREEAMPVAGRSIALPNTASFGAEQEHSAAASEPESGLRTNDLSPDWSPAVKLVRPGIIHRLDRATSGLLVVAKTHHALSVLSKHFRKGKVKKSYLAVVDGAVEGQSGSIDAPIGRHPDTRPHWQVMETGRPARTKWSVLSRGWGWTKLELEPVTGRTNQLRIHCYYSGHPILGDELYGAAFSETQANKNDHSATGCSKSQGEAESAVNAALNFPSRLLLHAWKLAFYHPSSGDWLEFTAPPPPEIMAFRREGHPHP
ncbi:MAG TPA: RluA family pseudouridine synthase [Blastocatellia bacterium]